MQLSDAIMMGSTTLRCTNPGSWSYCALGMGLSAVGDWTSNDESAKDREISTWPWIMDVFPVPQDLQDGLHFQKSTARWIISWYFHMVCQKRMALEHLVDWVRQNEPKEIVSATMQEVEIESVNA